VGDLIAVLFVVGLTAIWWRFFYVRSDRRMYSPVWLAFTTTFTAALFLITGSIGYTLSALARMRAGTPWTGEVIWWQVGIGLVMSMAAVYFWWRGSREIDRRLGRA
jgi:membrane protein implicated in regulation of membrane protease activity